MVLTFWFLARMKNCTMELDQALDLVWFIACPCEVELAFGVIGDAKLVDQCLANYQNSSTRIWHYFSFEADAGSCLSYEAHWQVADRLGRA